MLLGLMLVVVASCVGVAAIQRLSIAKRMVGLGVAPLVGLAVLVVSAVWVAFLGLPMFGASALFCILASVGLRRAIGEAGQLLSAPVSVRLSLAVLAVAFASTVVVLGVAFWGIRSPLAAREGVDGALHVHIVDTLRHGARWDNWYPFGLHAMYAGLLGLVPWVDSTVGSTWLSLGLSLMVPVGVFAVGYAVTERVAIGGAGALLTALTLQPTYGPHVWSGWPFLLGLLLTLGVWTLSAEYVRRPSLGLAISAGLFGGAIILTHGTELYTTAIVLLVNAIAALRHMPWRHLWRDVPVAAVVALVCAAPYMPALIHWAADGAAITAGLENLPELDAHRPRPLIDVFLKNGSDALGLDLPVRLILLTAGVGWSIRNPNARVLVAMAAVVLGVAALFREVSTPFVQHLFALVFPWGQPYRLLSVAAVPMAVLAGAGAVWLLGRTLHFDLGSARLGRLVRRTLEVLVPCWLVLGSWALIVYLRLLSTCCG